MGITCDIAGEPQREATKNPKQKRSQPQKGSRGPMAPTTRTNSHTTTRSNARAGRCTRYGTMHPIRGTAPDQKRCIAYGSGAAPQHTRTNAEQANRATPRHNQPELRTPGGHRAGVRQICCALNPHGAGTHKTAPASSHGDRGRGRGWLSRSARAYSLTAPAVRPDTMYFCRYWNSRTTGMAAITEPAAKMPHGAVRESAAHMYMPTASVNWL